MENSNLAYASGVKEERKGVAKEVVERLASANKFQAELIMQIESKLHEIINLREPEKDSPSIPNNNAIITDFFSALNSELNNTNSNGGKLERIFFHLQKIV